MKPPVDIPERINGYRILAPIGRGGMGVVYRAKQESIEREIALKVLSPKLASDRVFIARLLDEARAAGKFDHPNIVKAIDAGEADGYHYFAMELVEGESLSEKIAGIGKLPPTEALDITRAIADALRYASQHHMVHLDLKPSNILIDKSGVPKLADFGLARRVSDQDAFYTEKKMLFGTPRYMSPEHITRSSELDIRSDIYSLGVTFYEALAGVSPYEGSRLLSIVKKVKAGDFVPLEKRDADVSPDFCAVVHKMMAKNREDRHQSPEHLLADLEALQKGVRPVYAFDEEPQRDDSVTAIVKSKARDSLAGAGKRYIIGAVAIGLVILAAAAVVSAIYLRDIAVARAIESVGEIPPPPPEDEYSAACEYRQMLMESRRLVAAERFAGATAVVDAFLEKHEDEEKESIAGLKTAARENREEIEGVVSEKMEDIRSSIAQALRSNNWDEARLDVEKMAALDAPEAVEEAKEFAESIDRAEAEHRERERRLAAAAAFENLKTELDRLRRNRQYRAALAEHRKFMENESYHDYHDRARPLGRPFELAAGAINTAIRGAEEANGRKIPELGGVIREVRDDMIIVEEDQRAIPIRARDLAGSQFHALAREAGEEDLARISAGAAIALYDARNFADALDSARVARLEGIQAPDNLFEEIEVESMFRLAQIASQEERWDDCLAMIQDIRSRYTRSSFFERRRAAVNSMAENARHMSYLDSGMVRIPRGNAYPRPDRPVRIDEFYIDKHEVSVTDYAEFLDAIKDVQKNPYSHPEQPANKNHTPLNWEKQQENPDHPIVGVDWFDAYAYAKWAAKRLPSELEWERAARGDSLNRYPWGHEWDEERANFIDSITNQEEKGLMPVDSLPEGASQFGCFHMSGNAREWTALPPAGTRTLYTVKGGSYQDTTHSLNIGRRVLLPREHRDMQTGFRCVIGLGEGVVE